jgi:hypothetical protein
VLQGELYQELFGIVLSYNLLELHRSQEANSLS